MIAWVAARNDGDSRAARCWSTSCPPDVSIFGPTQIEARIDQTPEISSQITLWDQSGSSVIRGNLIVVPVGGSFVYLQPIYLQSTSSAFPQFTKIVVATPSKVAWADTLSEALPARGRRGHDAAADTRTGRARSRRPAPDAARPQPRPGRMTGRCRPTSTASSRYANEHFQLAQDAIGSGDYVTYGQEMAKVQAALERLSQLTGG